MRSNPLKKPNVLLKLRDVITRKKGLIAHLEICSQVSTLNKFREMRIKWLISNLKSSTFLRRGGKKVENNTLGNA
jgi:hypothetical protein